MAINRRRAAVWQCCVVARDGGTTLEDLVAAVDLTAMAAGAGIAALPAVGGGCGCGRC